MLAKTGLLAAALICLTLTFSLLIAWVCFFWLQTQLLLQLSAFLRFCYDVPKDSGDGEGGDGGPPGKPLTREKPDESSKHSYVNTTENRRPRNCADQCRTNASNEIDNTLPTSHASNEFDLFEAFLNSPKYSHQHSNLLEETKRSSDSYQRHDVLFEQQDGCLPEPDMDLRTTRGNAEDETEQEHAELRPQIAHSEEPVVSSGEDETTKPILAYTSEQLKVIINLRLIRKLAFDSVV